MKIILTLFFIWTVWDRLISMFCQHKKARLTVSVIERSNSALMMFFYAGIAFYGFFVMISLPRVNGPLSFIGIIFYLSSRALRNAAIRALGKQWNIYTSAAPISEISKGGPFRLVRHPYYLATFGELLGYAFSFNALYAGVAALFLFLPLLLWIRITVEEKDLVRRFPKEYGQYRDEVGLFFKK